jgi:hypothetical protein
MRERQRLELTVSYHSLLKRVVQVPDRLLHIIVQLTSVRGHHGCGDRVISALLCNDHASKLRSRTLCEHLIRVLRQIQGEIGLPVTTSVKRRSAFERLMSLEMSELHYSRCMSPLLHTGRQDTYP